MNPSNEFEQLEAIAVVGMTGRFPGARNVEQFWQNLRDGVESITFFSDEELLASGVAPEVLRAPNYVKAKPIIEDIDLFDASFFKLTPREAEVMDPQYRLFLECAWEALENAGYDPDRYPGRIGVYAGAEMCGYLLNNLLTNRERLATLSGLQVIAGVDRSYLSTRASYELNLRGPSITVQTACSTSLVAVHLACESLLNSECDMALAGGVAITLPHKVGYRYEETGVVSPDGHCRAFDARARGTVFGNGIGLLVLKRLEDALAEGDTIYALIRGSAVNNDGAFKVGYTAPSVDGQAAVIAEALSVAGVDPATVTYVEAHGTGTELGDPIEITALTQAFHLHTDKKNFCAIGSVKTNIGHLAVAAGAAGLIKTIMALRQGQIPPSLHFEQSNPKIDFENSPFYVNAALREWQTDGFPRRAGISSFGMGGTNAHVVLEEAPEVEPAGPSRPWQLLLLSAKTRAALERATDNLAAHLKQHPELDLADVAYTLQVGRRVFSHRRALVYHNLEEAVTVLETRDTQHLLSSAQETDGRPVAFMFPGLGDQYPNMALELYRSEATFRAEVDRCCDILKPLLGLDLRQVLFPEGGQKKEAAPPAQATAVSDGGRVDLRRMLQREAPADEATQRLNQTAVAHPAVFVIEYALARLLMSWGVQPHAMTGHSIGEYVAACLAGVFSLPDALTLVARRARLIQALPPGAMLAVLLSEEQVKPLLGPELSLSAINGPSLCVLAGPPEAVAALEDRLLAEGTACRRVQTSHAFHSKMMEPIMQPLADLVRTFTLKSPKIPYVSNLTGTWLTAEQATDPNYWAQHTRHPVRFADGVRELWQDPSAILLEIGPGHTLSTLAVQHPASQGAAERVLSSLRHAYESQTDLAFLLSTLGQLWLAGVPVDWAAFSHDEQRRRLPLPTYPFERQRYWVEPGKAPTGALAPLVKQARLDDWFYIPSWKRSMPPVREARAGGERWLVFSAGENLSAALMARLQAQGDEVVVVLAGEAFEAGSERFTVRPAQREDYAALLTALAERGPLPRRIVHLWNVPPLKEGAAGEAERALQCGFFSPLYLAQALDAQEPDGEWHLAVISSQVQQVASTEAVQPEKAVLLGPCRVIPQERPGLVCRSIDLAPPPAGSPQEAWLVEQIVAEVETRALERTVAYRGSDRWVQVYEAAPLPESAGGLVPLLRQGGVYLVTEGLDGLGRTLAQALARRAQARLVLTTAGELPAPETLEALGAEEVLVVQADVTDATQMADVVRKTRKQFGALNGVVHAAAHSANLPLLTATEETVAQVLAPKVRGTRLLAQVLGEQSLDFVLLCSSLSTVLGGPGQVADSAANAFLDAFAQARRAQGETTTLAVNWEMADGTTGSPPPSEEEMMAAFERILNRNRLPQIAVSSLPLPTLIEQARHAAPDGAAEPTDETQVADAIYERPDLPTAYIAPHDDTEEKLAGIWQRLLGVKKVGRNDNFFRLGGHSLVAMQLIARVRDDFEIEMPLRMSFEAPTIAELAERIAQARRTAGDAPVQPIVPVPRGEPLPLSYVQQQLWLLAQGQAGRQSHGPFRRLLAALRRLFTSQAVPGAVQADDAAFTVSAAVHLSGQLDVSVLLCSLVEVVQRHEALRTTFTMVEGEARAIVAPTAIVMLPLVDLQALGGEVAPDDVSRWWREVGPPRFDLTHGPLWRVVLLTFGSGEYLLLLQLHRLVGDDWSAETFVRELAALYQAFVAGQPSSLPSLPVQYADYAAWQQQGLPLDVLRVQLDYWQQQLGSPLPRLSLPADHPRPKTTAAPSAQRTFTLSPELSQSLRALSQDEGVTLFVTLLAAFQTWLYRQAGQADVVVGASVANRQRSEVEELIGPFGNTLALRTNLAGNPSFRELLKRVREGTLAAFVNQDLPFETLVAELQPEREPGQPPFFEVMFGLQNEPLETVALPELALHVLEIDGRWASFDLTLLIKDVPQGLKATLTYNAALFEAATAARLIDSFQALLAGVVADPEQRLAQLPLRAVPEAAVAVPVATG